MSEDHGGGHEGHGGHDGHGSGDLEKKLKDALKKSHMEGLQIEREEERLLNRHDAAQQAYINEIRDPNTGYINHAKVFKDDKLRLKALKARMAVYLEHHAIDHKLGKEAMHALLADLKSYDGSNNEKYAALNSAIADASGRGIHVWHRESKKLAEKKIAHGAKYHQLQKGADEQGNEGYISAHVGSKVKSLREVQGADLVSLLEENDAADAVYKLTGIEKPKKGKPAHGWKELLSYTQEYMAAHPSGKKLAKEARDEYLKAQTGGDDHAHGAHHG